MNERIKFDSYDRVRFFPVFFASTISVLMESIQNIQDESIIGNLLDDSAFGATNLLEPLGMSENFLEYLICIGGCALIARADGKGDKSLSDRIFSHCLTACVLLGVIYGLMYLFGNGVITDLVAGDSPLEPYVSELIAGNLLEVLVEPVSLLLTLYVLYKERVVLSSISAVLLTLSNFGASILLGDLIGAAGVPLGTGIGNLVGSLVLLTYFIKKENRVRIHLHIDKGLLKDAAVIGFPDSSVILMFLIAEAVMNQVSMDNFGEGGLVVTAVALNLHELVYYFSNAISDYETLSINHYIGSGKREGISHTMKVATRTALVEGAIFSLLYVVFADELVGIFDVDNEVVAASASDAVRIVALTPVAITLVQMIGTYYVYMGRVLRAFVLMDGAWAVAPAIFACLFGGMSITGATIGMVTGTLLWLVVMIIYAKVIRREKGLTAPSVLC